MRFEKEKRKNEFQKELKKSDIQLMKRRNIESKRTCEIKMSFLLIKKNLK